jgi:hypothetical protein
MKKVPAAESAAGSGSVPVRHAGLERGPGFLAIYLGIAEGQNGEEGLVAGQGLP